MLLGRFGVLLGPCGDKIKACFIFLTSFLGAPGSLECSLGAVLGQDETLFSSSLVPVCPLPYFPSTVCLHGFGCFMIIINFHLSTVSNCYAATLSLMLRTLQLHNGRAHDCDRYNNIEHPTLQCIQSGPADCALRD